MRQYSQRAVAALTAVVCCAQFASCTTQPTVSALQVSGAMKPYTYTFEPEDYTDHKLLDPDTTNPLRLGRAGINFTLNGMLESDSKLGHELIKEGELYLDFLIAGYPPLYKQTVTDSSKGSVWQYPFEFQGLPAGWVSGMSQAFIALGFLAGYEASGKTEYRDNAAKAMNGMVADVDKGGSLLKLPGDACLFEEYAWPQLNADNAFYVLNGFLFSLLATRLYTMVSGDTLFVDWYDCGVRGLASIADKYLFPDKQWLLYALNLPNDFDNIEATHYVLVEMRLLEALYKVDPLPLYAQLLQQHRDVLLKQYPLQLCALPNGQTNYLFSLIGAPHPYRIDTYGINFKLRSSLGEVLVDTSVNPYEYQKPIMGRGFITGRLPSNATTYSVETEVNGRKSQFHDGKLSDLAVLPSCEAPENAFTVDLSCTLDAQCHGDGTVSIDPMLAVDNADPESYLNHRGRVTATLHNPMSRQQNKYLGMLVHTGADVVSTTVTLTDVKGKTSTRYYTKLKADADNLILLHWTGFPESWNLDDKIKSIRLDVPTKPMLDANVPEFAFNIKKVLGFPDNLAMHQYFKTHAFYFPEQMSQE